MNIGNAVPDDQLVAIGETGDAQDRVGIKSIGAGDQLSIIGHPIAIGIAGTDYRKNPGVTYCGYISINHLKRVAARLRVRPIVVKGAETRSASGGSKDIIRPSEKDAI